MSTLQAHEPDPYEEVLVSPRYLAGLGVSGEASFAPVAHWPRHDLGDSPCQLLVTSPDHRIRIGWFGDDWDVWKITASPESVGAPQRAASFNHLTLAEIVAGLTAARPATTPNPALTRTVRASWNGRRRLGAMRSSP
ncbi:MULTISPECIES: DUF317 domain-containing protein [unclassified Streptomyces]|uniref:DUF317 domain-containing protein n=1 Tax=unclassified Streptomyces TaxID=2593676 RepID=UPI0018F32FD4|nr:MULTISPECIES: DUF317 domain-containing protein [unclassified Streptomyces]